MKGRKERAKPKERGGPTHQEAREAKEGGGDGEPRAPEETLGMTRPGGMATRVGIGQILMSACAAGMLVGNPTIITGNASFGKRHRRPRPNERDLPVVERLTANRLRRQVEPPSNPQGRGVTAPGGQAVKIKDPPTYLEGHTARKSEPGAREGSCSQKIPLHRKLSAHRQARKKGSGNGSPKNMP
jgi:hypothetical protein